MKGNEKSNIKVTKTKVSQEKAIHLTICGKIPIE